MAEKKPRYCPVCNLISTESNIRKFGKYFCSQEHLEMYAAAEIERLKQYEVEDSLGLRQAGGG